MRPISQKIRQNFKAEKCYCCGGVPIERHHALIYKGRQINEVFAIVPLCVNCHRGNGGRIFLKPKELSEFKAIKDGLKILKQKYSKFNWEQRLNYLLKKYEKRT